MPQITGISAVRKALRKHGERLGLVGKPSVIVGYTANYALHVHENIEMKWAGMARGGEVHTRIVFSKKLGRNIRKEMTSKQISARIQKRGNYWDGSNGPGQAKFLEQPARELGPEFSRIVFEAMKNGAKLVQALYIAGLRLQRESQLLVPVETGNLKASAFTRKE